MSEEAKDEVGDVSISVRDRAKHLNKITSESDLQSVTAVRKSAERTTHHKVQDSTC